MKIHLPDIEFFVWTLLLSLALEAVMSSFVLFHWREAFNSNDLLVLLQLLSILGLLCWLKATRTKRIEREREWQTIWANSRKSFLLKVMIGFHEISNRTFLAFLFCFSCYLSFCCLSISSSIAFCDFKQYELAERLYKLTPWPFYKGDETIVGLMDDIRPEDNHVLYDIEINKVINKIYGQSSSQAAHRRSMLGERFRCCAVRNMIAGDQNKALEQYSSSWFWFENSLEDHRKLSNRLAIAFDLSNIAYCTARLGARKEAIDALQEADLVISHLFDSEDVRSIQKRLDLAANILNVKPYPCAALPVCRNHAILDATTIAVLLPILVWFGLFLCGSRRICCQLNVRILNRILSAQNLNLEERLKALCELTSTHLYLKNVNEAEETSIKLLRLAESRE